MDQDVCEQLKAATIGMDEQELVDLLMQNGGVQDPETLAAYLVAPEDEEPAEEPAEEEPLE